MLGVQLQLGRHRLCIRHETRQVLICQCRGIRISLLSWVSRYTACISPKIFSRWPHWLLNLVIWDNLVVSWEFRRSLTRSDDCRLQSLHWSWRWWSSYLVAWFVVGPIHVHHSSVRWLPRISLFWCNQRISKCISYNLKVVLWTCCLLEEHLKDTTDKVLLHKNVAKIDVGLVLLKLL